jgi:hypothetical protein
MSGFSSTASPGQVPKIVTGERLAKSTVGYPWWVRAQDAALWLAGEAEVKPTAKLACAVFGVSYPRLRQAQARLRRRDRSKPHVNGNGRSANGHAPNLDDGNLDRIVAALGADRVLASLDRVTQPQLPLQAAE